MFKNFIKELIKYENKHLLPDYYYKEAKTKYEFGECESLVSLLYVLDKKKGYMIEIKTNSSFYDDIPAHHYIYKASNNRYYDINGEFNNIVDLIHKGNIFEDFLMEEGLIEITKMKNIFVDKDTIEKVKLISNIISKKDRKKVKLISNIISKKDRKKENYDI